MRVVGVDISDTTITIAEVRQRFGSMALRSISRFSLPEGLVEKGIIRDDSTLFAALKACAAQAKPHPIELDAVYCSVPSPHVFTHTFSFPRELLDQEIDEAIAIQCSEYFPFEIEEAAYDWQVIEESDQTQLVLVAACERQYVAQWPRVGKSADLEIAGIDVELVSTGRALLPLSKGPEGYMLADFGAHVTSLSIFDRHGLRSTHVLDSGGEKLTKQIIKREKVDLAAAEELKKTIHLAPSGQQQNATAVILRHIVEEQLKSVVAEIERTAGFFEQANGRRIAKITLCGGGSLLPGLPAYLEQALDRPCSHGNALQHLRHHDMIADKQEALASANVIGLAIGALNRKHHQTRFNFLNYFQQ